MATYTKKLHLLKKDPATDGADTFNIRTMLNENWDAIDAAMEQTEQNLSNKAPLTHASQHRTGGSDPITPQDIGAAPTQHTHTTAQVSGLSAALNGKAPASHTHTKNQITDFPASLPASDVPAWAKQPQKPSYTASEVGAVNKYTTMIDEPLTVDAVRKLDVGTYGWVSNTRRNWMPTELQKSGGAIRFSLTIHNVQAGWNPTMTLHCIDGALNCKMYIGDYTTERMNWKQLADTTDLNTKVNLGWFDGDLNTLMADGHYRLGGNVTNTPGEGAWCHIFVSHGTNTDNAAQILVTNNSMYHRIYWAGAWSSWAKVVDTSTLDATLKGYLPLTGGRLTGELQMYSYLGIHARHIDGNSTEHDGALYLNYHTNKPVLIGSAGYEVIHTGNAAALLASQKAGLQLLQDVTVQQSGLTRISVNIPSSYWSDWKAIHIIANLKNYTSARFEDATVSRLNMKTGDWWVTLLPHYDPTFALTIDYNSTWDHGRVISVTQKFQDIHTAYFYVIESNGVTTMQVGSRFRFYGEK